MVSGLHGPAYAPPVPHPSGRPWIVAHRGASHAQRENTLAAFTHAAELGADGVELDVRATADGALVVHHNALVTNRPIVALTRDELAVVDPGIPDLAAAIAACAGLWIDVEVKNDPADPDWDPDAAVAARTVAALRGRRDIVLSSFDRGSVATALAAGMRSGLVLDHGTDPRDALDAVPGIEMLFPPLMSMGGGQADAVVAAAGRRGIEIGVWWTDDPGEMRRLAAAGVGVIFTNRPDVGRAALG